MYLAKSTNWGHFPDRNGILNNVKPGENKKSSDHKNEMNILLEAPSRLADKFADFLVCINTHLAASFSSCK